VAGEVYVVLARPGEERGHHFHRTMGEWFVAVSGSGILRAADPLTGATESVVMDRVRIYVPAGIAHALVNTGTTDLIVVALADRAHDPDDVVRYLIPAPQ
jgi:oxalate decarboxylase/phosphoglucose isomerase-like protein (cupin superfamily)